MPWSEYAPRAPLDVLEDFYRFGDVVSRGTGVVAKAPCIKIPEIESQIMLGTKRASCVRYGCAEERLGFSVAI